ncbi:UNVERIFIED_CONTAM: hypothetical protein K2H54_019547 [Gekko kuhli]
MERWRQVNDDKQGHRFRSQWAKEEILSKFLRLTLERTKWQKRTESNPVVGSPTRERGKSREKQDIPPDEVNLPWEGSESSGDRHKKQSERLQSEETPQYREDDKEKQEDAAKQEWLTNTWDG